MDIVVIGKSGQLAMELANHSWQDCQVICLGREDINLFDQSQLEKTLAIHKPAAVINASAYTAVDTAEIEHESAYRLNSIAVSNLAHACNKANYFLVHVSTDFVFDGKKRAPYEPEDELNPLNVYGASKAQGEQWVTTIIPDNACILRTSWVYSNYGNNFVNSMLKQMSARQQLAVVSDQLGSPTYAKGLAAVCVALAQKKMSGKYHWSDTGVVSWYDFAVAIQQISIELGLLQKAIPMVQLKTSDYPTVAKRPAYSVLNNASLLEILPNLEPLHWRNQLTSMLIQLTSDR